MFAATTTCGERMIAVHIVLVTLGATDARGSGVLGTRLRSGSDGAQGLLHCLVSITVNIIINYHSTTCPVSCLVPRSLATHITV